MDYFERSQQVKAEIEADSNLCSRIRERIQGAFNLDVIGMGTQHVIYRVGQTNSGLWVALRENTAWGRAVNKAPAAARLYNSYCLDAEQQPEGLPPAFCIGGLCDKQTFLLVEDVFEGRSYTVEANYRDRRMITLFEAEKPIKDKIVNIGEEDPYYDLELDNETQLAICLGTFDLDTLKYFSQKARLNL